MKPTSFISAAIALVLFDTARWIWLLAIPLPPLQSDAAEYWAMGGAVAQGDWWLEGFEIAFRTPGYPWLVGVMRWCFPGGETTPLVIAQGIMLCLTTIFGGLTLWQLTRHPPSVLLLLVLHALSFSRATYTTLVLTETWFTCIFALHLWCCVVFYQRSWLHPKPCLGNLHAGDRCISVGTCLVSIAVGASWGLLVLIRPIALYLPLVHALAIFLVHRRLPRLVQGTSIMIACCTGLLLLFPWLMRNQRMFGETLVTEFVGRNLWIVTFQDGAAADLPLPITAAATELRTRVERAGSTADLRKTWEVSRALRASGMDDVQTDRLMKQVAMQAVAQQPVRWSLATIRRMVNYWRCVSDHLPGLGNAAPTHWLLWCTLTSAATGLFGCVGLLRGAHRGWVLWLGLVAMYFASVTAIVEIPEYRYRLVVEPVMALLFTLGCYAAIHPPRPQDSFRADRATLDMAP